MSSASVNETNGHPPSENGHDGRHRAAAPPPSSSYPAPSAAELESAIIAHADIYRGRGTTHLRRCPVVPRPSSANPTGAVVPAMILATAFRQVVSPACPPQRTIRTVSG